MTTLTALALPPLAPSLPSFVPPAGQRLLLYNIDWDAYVTLGEDDHSVFSNGGTALVIHEVAAAGAAAPPRIACGVIAKTE